MECMLLKNEVVTNIVPLQGHLKESIILWYLVKII